MLLVRNLKKEFPETDRPGVKRIDLKVEEGEILGLIGESGSGKTTVLRCIAGLEEPTEGTIQLDRQLFNEGDLFIPPEKRNIRMVFQETTLFPHLTVFRNVLFGVEKSASSIPEKVSKILSLVRLDGLEERYPHQLSGGQRQRAELARSLISDPKLLLLDEPFSNLDPPLKDALRTEIRGILASTKTTAIIVSHDAEDAFALADRIALLRNGEISQYGTPRDLYDNPADEYVASQVGPANIISGIVLKDGYLTDIGHLYCSTTEPLNQPVKLCIRPTGFSLEGKNTRSIQATVLELVLGRGGSSLRVAVPINNKSASKELIVKKPNHGDYRIGSFIELTALPDQIWRFPNPSFKPAPD
jgi:iron(III) transport system ATP-binding protein